MFIANAPNAGLPQDIMTICASNDAVWCLANYLFTRNNSQTPNINDPIVINAFKRHHIIKADCKDVFAEIKQKLQEQAPEASNIHQLLNDNNTQYLYRIVCAIKDCTVKGKFFPECATQNPDGSFSFDGVNISKERAELCLLASYFVEYYPNVHVSAKQRNNFLSSNTKNRHNDEKDMPVVDFIQQNNYLGFEDYQNIPMSFLRLLNITPEQHYERMIKAQVEIAMQILKDPKNQGKHYNLVVPCSNTWGQRKSIQTIIDAIENIFSAPDCKYEDLNISIMIACNFLQNQIEFKDFGKQISHTDFIDAVAQLYGADIKNLADLHNFYKNTYIPNISIQPCINGLGKCKKIGFYNWKSKLPFPSNNTNEIWCFANAGDPFTVPGNEGFPSVCSQEGPTFTSTDVGVVTTDLFKYRVPKAKRNECGFQQGFFKLPRAYNKQPNAQKDVDLVNMPKDVCFLTTQGMFITQLDIDEEQMDPILPADNTNKIITKPPMPQPIISPVNPLNINNTNKKKPNVSTNFSSSNTNIKNKIEKQPNTTSIFNIEPYKGVSYMHTLPQNTQNNNKTKPTIKITENSNKKNKANNANNSVTIDINNNDNKNNQNTNNIVKQNEQNNQNPESEEELDVNSKTNTRSYLPSYVGGTIGTIGVSIGIFGLANVIDITPAVGVTTMIIGATVCIASIGYGAYCYNGQRKAIDNNQQTNYSLQDNNQTNITTNID